MTTTMTTTMTNEISVFAPQDFGAIAQAAPQAYSENKVSNERCLAYGQSLLQRAETDGMNDELDQKIAVYVERARKTLKIMNGKRSGVTQLFDSVRSAFTALENEVDPAKKGTVPAQLQELRNKYAAKKRAEYEAEQLRIRLEQASANARAKYATDVEGDIMRQFNSLVASACSRLVQLDGSVSLDNYDAVVSDIKRFPDRLPDDWLTNLSTSVPLPSTLSPEEAQSITDNVRQGIANKLAARYTADVAGLHNDILDRLPSKRKELKRIAQANAEEAERIKRQMQERELREAERRERERAEHEAKEKAAAELAAQKQEMDSLFGEARLENQQPKVSAKKRIHILNAEGFVQVVGLWWSQYGRALSIEELEKIFSRQLTFCNKLANDKDNAVLLESEYIEYIDEIKAK